MGHSPNKANYRKTALRLPPDLHAAVHEEAARQERTFNGQIVAILRAALMPQSEEAEQKTPA